AYSATPSCIAARAATYTGLSQESHGRVGYKDGVTWNYPVTLAGEFTAGGYQTQAIGKMHVYPQRSQMGFQNVILHDGHLHFSRRHSANIESVDDYLPWLREHDERTADYFDHGVNCNSYVARPWDKQEYLHPTNWIVTQGIDFLRRRDTRKPFLLYLSFHRPHPPYDPPAWAFEQYVGQSMPPVPRGDWLDAFDCERDPHRPDAFVDEIDPRLLHRARAGYYGHMTHIDHQINRFLEALDDYSLSDNTYVCFMSDHGEMLGDHDMFRKGYPYEGSARVPLILRGPKDSGIVRGGVYDQVVAPRDIMPTLLDCASLEIPSSVEGKSFLPIARGEGGKLREYLHGEHTRRGGSQSLHWLTDGLEKYIWFSDTGMEQLFDLQEDPQENCDLARHKASAGRVERWRERMIETLSGREEGFCDGAEHKLIAGRAVSPTLSFLSDNTSEG
ncbi:MAG: arylsulfatase, partial [Planctomycetes bacterium]|nr:arylsulfatase [Planctomycetota bacterium]